MWKKNLIYAIALTIVAGGLGVASALAQQDDSDSTDNPIYRCFGPGPGRHSQQMLDDKAEILGMTTDELKVAWDKGKTWQEILSEAGLTEEEFQAKMQELHKQNIKIHLDELVAGGKITQEQADERYNMIENQMEDWQFQGGHHLFGPRGPRAPNWQGEFISNN